MGAEIRISNPPVFNFERAEAAKKAISESEFASPSNLACAGNLWLYNTPSDQWPRVLGKLHDLKMHEIVASARNNPLPTIGWEVESPRKPFERHRAPLYARFFDLMGLPRNKVNADSATISVFGTGMWEFSIEPAYSSCVANRTLCELIRGGFIPHLEGEGLPTPLQRRELLGDKLVSLHVNLGTPWWLREANVDSNILYLASSFELAYTSSERFRHRSQIATIVLLKRAEPTAKNEGINNMRFEIKALEVGNSNTYRMMYEMQLVATAAFSAIAEKNSRLSKIWRNIRDEIGKIYAKHDIQPEVIKEVVAVSSLVSSSMIQEELRPVLTEGAHRVRMYLSSKGMYYLPGFQRAA